jgi:hypothetical protein
MKSLKSWLLLGATALALAACGGGGGDSAPDSGSPTAAGELPTEATQSISGWIAYLTQQIAAGDAADGREPVTAAATSTTPPVDDGSEPFSP